MGNFDELYAVIKLARELCTDIKRIENLSQDNKDVINIIRDMDDRCVQIMNLTNVVLQEAV